MKEQIIIKKLIAAVLEHQCGYSKEEISDEDIDDCEGSELWEAFEDILKPMQQEIDRLNLENEDYAQAAD